MHLSDVAAPPGKRRQNRQVIAAAWVRAARDHAGLTQEDLARRLDVTSGTVSKRETGDMKVYVETWLAILNACGLPREWKPQ
jgi:transcriptional regulator with XRE-family HTH domain